MLYLSEIQNKIKRKKKDSPLLKEYSHSQTVRNMFKFMFEYFYASQMLKLD